ncbi:MAG: hypothetical protein WDO13_02850 [Verrucomicrobiota bacterium]
MAREGHAGRPAQGANFHVLLRNGQLTLFYDAAGNESVGGQDRGAVLFVYTENPETGEEGLRVVRTFSADPAFLLGPYGNARLALVEAQQTASVSSPAGGDGLESWRIADAEPGRGHLALLLRYAMGVPQRVRSTFRMYGGSDPAFFRTYRADRGMLPVRSVPLGLNRVGELHWEMKLTELAGVFNGAERLLAIIVEPWFWREVWMPEGWTRGGPP